MQCRKQNRTLRSSIDACIAQIAIRCGARLLHNDRDFEAIASVSTLNQIRVDTRPSHMTTTNSGSAFINVGERTNVTGSAKFRKLIEQGDYQAALDGRAPAGRERRADHRRQHGRGPARQREGDGDVPAADRVGAGHRARADHDRQLEVERHRGGPEVRAGQVDRQLDLDERGRGAVPRAGQEVPALRRRRRGHGVRREGPGRHQGPQGRDLRSAPTSC